MNYRSLLIACLATLGLAVAGWGQADGKDVDNPADPSLSAGIGQAVTGSDGEAWVVGAIRRLTDYSASYSSPSWSPDGQHIAFGFERDGRAKIYVIGSDGSNFRRLTDHPAWAALPTWSPDGQTHRLRVRARRQRYLRDRFGWERPPQPDQRLALGLVSVLVSGWSAHRLRVPAR